jgi:hypothetical protein
LSAGNDIAITGRTEYSNSAESGRYPEVRLQGVFGHWMERLAWVSQDNDDYVLEAKRQPIPFSRIPVRDRDDTPG